MGVINKHYGRSVKGTLSKLTRRLPHTRVSSMYPPITCNRGNKTMSTRLYSARLTRQKKNFMICHHIWFINVYYVNDSPLTFISTVTLIICCSPLQDKNVNLKCINSFTCKTVLILLLHSTCLSTLML